ncbi:MAG: family 1 glycosylhydrolase [Armatimonadota bacterium]|nr:family 1 glycosylhydrolase [Armatimonadota bacterium]
MTGVIGFPRGFRWGTATSAYQVEGNNTASDWWVWEQQPGRIAGGGRSGLACDWWRNAERDFDLMAALHQNAARISIEWARLEPRADRWDDAALARYLEMLRALRDRGMEPLVTLNHFTLPQWVAERGGWLWDEIAAAFGAYAGRIVRAAAPLVDSWVTLNEPVGYLVNAYLLGRFPPGRTSLPALARALGNSLRAHAAAYRAIHAAQPSARVGVAADLRPAMPANEGSPAQRWLARQLDHVVNWMYLDALASGRLSGPLGLALSVSEAARTMDYVGVNYYSCSRLAFDLRRPRALFVRHRPRPEAGMSDDGYSEVYPNGLLAVLRRVRRYGLPVFITENGLADADDDLRPRFIVEHLRRVAQAIAEGVPVLGYYHWSLVDNFEWADGWNLRFGLYHLDQTTQLRTQRPSAALYGEICRHNALP